MAAAAADYELRGGLRHVVPPTPGDGECEVRTPVRGSSLWVRGPGRGSHFSRRMGRRHPAAHPFFNEWGCPSDTRETKGGGRAPSCPAPAVASYAFEFAVPVKGRWVGKQLLDHFSTEFPHCPGG